MQTIKTCKTCKFRNEKGICLSNKLADNESWYWIFDDTEDENKERVERTKDMLLYQFEEEGSFWVGEEFGCVHHEEK